MLCKKERNKNDFELEEERLLSKRKEFDPGSEEYDKVNNQIDKLYGQCEKKKELKRIVPNDIKTKVVSFCCMAGITGLIYFLEQKKGIALTGGFRDEGKGLLSGVAKLFTKFL